MQSILQEQLDTLSSSLPESDARASVEVLITLYQNIASHPDEEQYRRIRKENRRFREKVWCHSSAAQFLLLGGWVEAGEFIVYVDDNVSNVQSALDCLRKTARDSNLTPVMAVTSPQQQQYEARPDQQQYEARPDHVQDKDKQIEENMKRLKEHQQRVAEEKKRLADQIRADRKETTQNEARSSQAKVASFGGNIKRFEDIGIDLNKGG